MGKDCSTEYEKIYRSAANASKLLMTRLTKDDGTVCLAVTPKQQVEIMITEILKNTNTINFAFYKLNA